MTILTYIQNINNVFWNEEFWLSNNLTWADVSPPSNGTVNYTSTNDLPVPIQLALILIAIRYLLEKYCFHPLALYLGIQPVIPKEIPNIAVLERAYMSRGKVSHVQIVGLSKQLDWTERQVDRWLRLRRARDKPSTLVKFTETCWRFLYYACSFSYGCFCMWDEPWVRDSKLLLLDTPHAITTKCWWYCIVSCAFYWSLLFSSCFDVKRKDFLEMLLHHFVAITLMSFTFVINAHRPMCMGFWLFDASDALLEIAKLAKYAQFHKGAVVLSGLFVTVWMTTRWVWYPYWVLRVTLLEVLDYYEPCAIYFFGNILLLSIFALNAFWTYLIFIACHRGITQGSIEGNDPRSSDEEEISDEAEPFVRNNLKTRNQKKSGI